MLINYPTVDDINIMKIVNKTPNTIRLQDIDVYIPFNNGVEQEFSLDNAKKSNSFRHLYVIDDIDIVEFGDSLFERGLKKLKTTSGNVRSNYREQEKQELKVENNGMQVKIRGHFYEAGGYAKMNRNMAFGLDSLGTVVEIESTNNLSNDLNEEELRKIKRISRKTDRSAIVIDSMIPTFSNISNGRYRILYTTIEASSVPQQFIDIAQTYNEVWVPSNFCKEVLVKYGIKVPVFVMPYGFDVDSYKEGLDEIDFNVKLNNFVFLSVFGWSYRKGYDVLLRAYLEEFKPAEDVSLLVVSRFLCSSSRSDIVKETIKKYVDKYGGAKDTPHILRSSSVIPEQKMPNLYNSADSFVVFSRGEGFFCPAVEASLCGLPVISTNHSGHTMFLNNENSTLVDVDEISPLPTGLMHVHYWDGQLFPKLTSDKVIEDSKKAMRYVFENHKKAKKKNKKLQSLLNKEYSINYASVRMKDRLDEIWRKLK